MVTLLTFFKTFFSFKSKHFELHFSLDSQTHSSYSNLGMIHFWDLDFTVCARNRHHSIQNLNVPGFASNKELMLSVNVNVKIPCPLFIVLCLKRKCTSWSIIQCQLLPQSKIFLLTCRSAIFFFLNWDFRTLMFFAVCICLVWLKDFLLKSLKC